MASETSEILFDDITFIGIPSFPIKKIDGIGTLTSIKINVKNDHAFLKHMAEKS